MRQVKWGTGEMQEARKDPRRVVLGHVIGLPFPLTTIPTPSPFFSFPLKHYYKTALTEVNKKNNRLS
jgi:hypothetical protein